METLLRPLSSMSFGFSPRSSSFPGNEDPAKPAGKRKLKLPLFLRTSYVAPTIIIMVLLAVGIEVALAFSQKHQGFSTGKISTERVQWLSGFLPTLLIGPFVWIWKGVDSGFKKLQPYVNMSRGPVPPEQSVLLNLEHQNIFTVIKKSWRFGNLLVLASSVIVILNVLLHPMAGSFFLVRPGQTTGPSHDPVKSINTIALNPSYKDITSFVAAAGFAEAAAFHNLSDPPFIQGGWAVAQFKFPIDVTKNSTITVNTTAILSDPKCSKAAKDDLSPPTDGTSKWTLVSTLGFGTGCVSNTTIDVSQSINQYGVQALTGCSTKGDGAQTQAPFAPAFFWFYTDNQVGTPIARGIFCFPSIEAHIVEATVDGATTLLTNVTSITTLDANGNNVTGGSFAGKAFNGIAFESPADFNLTDPFVNARALAVESGVPGAIFRFASDPNGPRGGLSNVFNDANGFLSLTSQIYTQYLSIIALSNYFVLADNPINADLTTWPQRLWINPRNAHSLAALLLLVAITGTILHIVHRRQRKRLHLATKPGSVAHYMSILPNIPLSGAPSAGPRDSVVPATALDPNDSKRSMRRKLQGMEFVMDERTGRIIPMIPLQNTSVPPTPMPVSPGRNGERKSWRASRAPRYSALEEEKLPLGEGYTVEAFEVPTPTTTTPAIHVHPEAGPRP